MVHGMLASSAFWQLTIAPALRSRCLVLTYDMRGHGRSDMTPTGYTSAQMAEDLEALLDYLQIPLVHLLGHSFGGEVVLNFALRSPERVKSVTLADARIRALYPALIELGCLTKLCDGITRLGHGIRLGQAVAPAQIDIAECLFEECARDGLVAFGSSDGGLPGPFGLTANRRRMIERWIVLFGTTTINRDLRSSGGMTPGNIAGLRPPLLAMYGSESVFLPVLSRLQDLLPRCHKHVMSGAGHLFPLTRPAATLFQLSSFIIGSEQQYNSRRLTP
jgi:pimeloyl-ACP methyl ester carboxylesterase